MPNPRANCKDFGAVCAPRGPSQVPTLRRPLFSSSPARRGSILNRRGRRPGVEEAAVITAVARSGGRGPAGAGRRLWFAQALRAVACLTVIATHYGHTFALAPDF